MDWSKYPLKSIVNYAIELCSTGNFFEIVNESFFERLCESFKTEYDRLKAEAEERKALKAKAKKDKKKGSKPSPRHSKSKNKGESKTKR